MKKWFERARLSIMRFFKRRSGADNLGLALAISALILLVLGQSLRVGVLSLMALILCGWVMYRMFSKQTYKRMEENRRFNAMCMKAETEIRQFFVRLKNARKYKYYKCPGCKCRLRIPRGIGEKTVTCSKCHTTFRMKA